MKTFCRGGSSSILRKALAASSLRSCASSITTTRQGASKGRYLSRSLICRTWSILMNAPSFFTHNRSGACPESIFRHHEHRSQESSSRISPQWSIFAKAWATRALPIPASPVNNSAWGTRELAAIFMSSVLALVWPGMAAMDMGFAILPKMGCSRWNQGRSPRTRFLASGSWKPVCPRYPSSRGSAAGLPYRPIHLRRLPHPAVAGCPER